MRMSILPRVMHKFGNPSKNSGSYIDRLISRGIQTESQRSAQGGADYVLHFLLRVGRVRQTDKSGRREGQIRVWRKSLNVGGLSQATMWVA